MPMRLRHYGIAGLLAFIVGAGLGISDDSLLPTGLEPFDTDAFIDPSVCGRCHDELYEMWDGSMHSRAFDDPLFRAASKAFIEQTETPGERADAEHCVACHNPIAYRSGQIPGSSADYSAVTEVTRHAISCDMCHSISETVALHNAFFNTAPGDGESDPGVKRGPRDDAEPLYHKAAYSELHTSSRFCGTCHNVHHLSYLTKLEGTYDEWYNSPYNTSDAATTVTCQDCHMRQAPGNPSTGMTDRPDYPGMSSPMGVERPHIYRHNVVGANVVIPSLFQDQERIDLALERLEHAAELEVVAQGPTGYGQWAFTVRIRNEGAGHMLPTGVSEYRQMWLEVVVSDINGDPIYESGVLSDDEQLPENTRLFNTVFGDSDGNPTLNVARAAVMLTDHRVPPKGYIDERFVLPEKPDEGAQIRVTLFYRSLDPAVARALLGDDTPTVPAITMTEYSALVQ